MQSSYLLFVIGGVVGIAALLWVVHDGRPAREAIPITTGPASEQLPEQQAGHDQPGAGDNINALRREVAHLNADLRVLRRQLKKQATHAPVDSNTATSPAAAAPEFPDNAAAVADPLEEKAIAVEEEKRRVEERMQALETSLQNDPLDRSWSIQVSEQITQAFASEELAGISLDDVECRSTLCRVEVMHDDPMRRDEFEIWFPFKVAQFLPRLVMRRVDNDDGSSSTVVYTARQGYRLPDTR